VRCLLHLSVLVDPHSAPWPLAECSGEPAPGLAPRPRTRTDRDRFAPKRIPGPAPVHAPAPHGLRPHLQPPTTGTGISPTPPTGRTRPLPSAATGRTDARRSPAPMDRQPPAVRPPDSPGPLPLQSARSVGRGFAGRSPGVSATPSGSGCVSGGKWCWSWTATCARALKIPSQ
jgi:hypothetical protein